MKTVKISLNKIQEELLQMGPQKYGQTDYKLDVFSDGTYDVYAQSGNGQNYKVIDGEQEIANTATLVNAWEDFTDGYDKENDDVYTEDEYRIQSYEDYVSGEYNNILVERIQYMIDMNHELNQMHEQSGEGQAENDYEIELVD